MKKNNSNNNNKKTILILTHVQQEKSPYCIFVHNHAKALAEKGYKVIVLAPVTIKFSRKYWNMMKGKTKGVKVIDGVEVHYFKRLGFSNLLHKSKINLNGISYYLAARRKIKKIFKNNDVYYVDAHMFKIEGYVAKILKRKYNVPTLLTLHGTSFLKNLAFDNGINDIKKTANIIDSYVVVSNKFGKELDKLNIKNYKIILNGINYYANIPKKNNNLNIISVGTLAKRKNFDLTIKAFSIVKKKYKDAKLNIIGEGIEFDNLKKLVNDLSLNDDVKFLGRMNNDSVYKYYANSSVFVLPSVNEGFGIVYPESMYNGCIPIGTKNEGIDGFIENGVNGFLCNPNSEEIAKTIIDIFSKKYDNDKIRKNAIKKAQELNWDKNALEYINLVNEIYKK